MPKISKAARGKHRWIGLLFSPKFSDIRVLKDEINHILKNIHYRLYDYILDGSHGSCIIKIKLEQYKIVTGEYVAPNQKFTNTTSQKKQLQRKKEGDNIA